jgi:glycosyltransferase involved in cell wall biosynthesis
MAMPLINVGIDASGLAAGKQATGLQRYLGALVAHLAARAEQDGLRLFLYFVRPVAPAACAPGTPLSRARPGPFIRWRIAPLERGWHWIGMGLAMQRDRLDVFHFPGPRMAAYCPRPSVVTFHDLAALSVEAEQTQKERRYLPDALDAGRRATALIAVSQSARAEIAQYLGRSDVTVIPEGVDLAQFAPAPPAVVNALRARYGLERYILCVGTLQTRKNHLGLIAAFERIQEQIPHSLVLAGGDGSGAEAIRAHLAAHPNPRVRLLGYVEETILPALYTGAEVLALPSLWEGFGLPLIEAMACGTPALTSNTSSLAEIAGNAALLVNPRDEDDIAHGLLTVLTETAVRERLVSAGHERAQALSWDRAAEQTAAVYRVTAHRRSQQGGSKRDESA